jgi:uncharacterized membrane protein YccC
MANTYKLTLDALLDAARTTVAAIVSLLLARMLKLPESYWAPISAIVIIQSTLNPREVAWQRFAGTALGAVVGAIVATFLPSNTPVTLSIILLIQYHSPAWIVSWHRFVEVSLGIAVALAIAWVWPSRT